VRYVATASPANILDIHKKIKKALAVNGPSFVLAYSPCPTGWYIAGENSIEIARMAVQSRVFPVYEIEDGVLKFTQKIEKENAKPVKEYLQAQGRFKHLSEDEIARIQKYVDERYEFLAGIEGKKCFDVLF
jgi:pyruvate ferredoxin oxidoreductase beta subunit